MAIERITQKFETCNCGCKGRDLQHANVVKRQVRSIVYLDAPATMRIGGRTGFDATVVALGLYTVDHETFWCGFYAIRVEDRWLPMGWGRVDTDDAVLIADDAKGAA